MASLARQRGVNAVELMATLAIAGVLAAVAMPGMTNMVGSQRLKSASSDLHSSLLQARSEAVKRNSEIEMLPSASGWAGGWRLVAGGDTTIAVQGPYSSLAITGPASVVYTGTGRVDGDASPEFELSAESTENVRCVTVDLTGRPANKQSAC